MTRKDLKMGEIVFTKSQNEVELMVRFKKLGMVKKNEIALLFGKERSVITKHINKIFADKDR